MSTIQQLLIQGRTRSVNERNRRFSAAEDLNAGEMVNLFLANDEIKARRASADDPNKPAHGFANDDVASGALASIHIGAGRLVSVAHGFDRAKPLWLSTNGAMTQVVNPPGYVQLLGFPINADELWIEPEDNRRASYSRLLTNTAIDLKSAGDTLIYTGPSLVQTIIHAVGFGFTASGNVGSQEAEVSVGTDSPEFVNVIPRTTLAGFWPAVAVAVILRPENGVAFNVVASEQELHLHVETPLDSTTGDAVARLYGMMIQEQ